MGYFSVEHPPIGGVNVAEKKESGLPLPMKIQVSLPIPKRRVIVLSGPTATGKTTLSLEIAKLVDGEIISADSMQVYRGMDIGTAKVSCKDREEIPHHLIDIRSLREGFSVVEFYQDAACAIEEICHRGKVPVIVGGTGFYIHALLFGPPSGPASVEEVRSFWEQQCIVMGVEALFCKLQELDPLYARCITAHDRHKIVRALEIISLTGRRVSELPTQKDLSDTYDFRCWFLYFPKEMLYPRIEQRCDEMLRNGLLKEVQSLIKEGLCENTSASRAIGYRQCLEWLASSQCPSDYEAFVARFKQASRRYAKRQFTWFRKEEGFRWINRAEHSSDQVKELILQDFEQGS